MAGTRAGAVAAADGAWTTGGRLQGAGLDVAVERAPELTVNQASAGQVKVRTAETTSEPTEPREASRHRAGACDCEMSVQRRPEMPIRMTGLVGAPAAATLAWAFAVLAAVLTLLAVVLTVPPAVLTALGALPVVLAACAGADPDNPAPPRPTAAAQLSPRNLAAHDFTLITVSGPLG